MYENNTDSEMSGGIVLAIPFLPALVQILVIGLYQAQHDEAMPSGGTFIGLSTALGGTASGIIGGILLTALFLDQNESRDRDSARSRSWLAKWINSTVLTSIIGAIYFGGAATFTVWKSGGVAEANRWTMLYGLVVPLTFAMIVSLIASYKRSSWKGVVTTFIGWIFGLWLIGFIISKLYTFPGIYRLTPGEEQYQNLVDLSCPVMTVCFILFVGRVAGVFRYVLAGLLVIGVLVSGLAGVSHLKTMQEKRDNEQARAESKAESDKYWAAETERQRKKEEAAEAARRASDKDDDGVENAKDKCPDTAARAKANPRGCSVRQVMLTCDHGNVAVVEGGYTLSNCDNATSDEVLTCTAYNAEAGAYTGCQR